MKLRNTISGLLKITLLVLVPCTALSAENASSSTPAVDDSTVQVTVPRSVFIIPASAKDGKDPFFPDLTRYSAPTPPKPGKPGNTVDVRDLSLQGIAGQADARLCVINGRTFAPGEEGGVPTHSGQVQIRCLEINETNVVIELGGERRELRFKPLK